ncbi:hypothetical protein [Mesorhizobium sp. PAMC28654]|nr:hypothetical protein [Mesorhizobium sp. PAMC28654]
MLKKKIEQLTEKRVAVFRPKWRWNKEIERFRETMNRSKSI